MGLLNLDMEEFNAKIETARAIVKLRPDLFKKDIEPPRKGTRDFGGPYPQEARASQTRRLNLQPPESARPDDAVRRPQAFCFCPAVVDSRSCSMAGAGRQLWRPLQTPSCGLDLVER